MNAPSTRKPVTNLAVEFARPLVLSTGGVCESHTHTHTHTHTHKHTQTQTHTTIVLQAQKKTKERGGKKKKVCSDTFF